MPSSPPLAIKASNLLLIALQANFMLSNLAVERVYCHAPITAKDETFLLHATYEFGTKHNPLFMQRPGWMVAATCASAYGFLPFNMIIAATAALDAWNNRMLGTLSVLFCGAKLYAFSFHHYMELTSASSPPDLLVYFGMEVPYVISVLGVLYKVATAGGAERGRAKTS